MLGNPPKDPARAAELAERIIAIADSSISQAQVQFVNEFIQSREDGFLPVFVCGAGTTAKINADPLDCMNEFIHYNRTMTLVS